MDHRLKFFMVVRLNVESMNCSNSSRSSLTPFTRFRLAKSTTRMYFLQSVHKPTLFILFLVLSSSACDDPPAPISAKLDRIEVDKQETDSKRANEDIQRLESLVRPAIQPTTRKSTSANQLSPKAPKTTIKESKDATCTLVGSTRLLWDGFGAASIRRFGRRVLVAGYARKNGADTIYVLEVGESENRVLIHAPLASRRYARWAPPTISALGGQIRVAYFDGVGAVFVQNVDTKTIRKISAKGADLRFSPAFFTRKKQTHIAWTDGGKEMTVMQRSLESKSNTDPSKPVHASFETSAAPMSDGQGGLYIVDPRVSLSVLHQLSFDNGISKERVIKPLAHLYDPATYKVIPFGAQTWVGYVALGKDSKTAIGLQRGLGNPEALISSKGYGPLRIDGIKVDGGTIWVGDSPINDKKNAPREIHLLFANSNEIKDQLTVVSDKGRGYFPSIGKVDNHNFWLTFTDGDTTFAQQVHCKF